MRVVRDNSHHEDAPAKAIDSLEELYPLILRQAAAIVGPDDAEDVAQETFLRLLSSPEPYSARGWLSKVARNLSIDEIRRRRRAFPTDTLPDHPARLPETSELLAIREAVNNLPERYRLVLWLKEVEGRTAREIAESLATTQSSVELSLFRARKALRNAYEKPAGVWGFLAFPLTFAKKLSASAHAHLFSSPAVHGQSVARWAAAAAVATSSAVLLGPGNPPPALDHRTNASASAPAAAKGQGAAGPPIAHVQTAEDTRALDGQRSERGAPLAAGGRSSDPAHTPSSAQSPKSLEEQAYLDTPVVTNKGEKQPKKSASASVLQTTVERSNKKARELAKVRPSAPTVASLQPIPTAAVTQPGATSEPLLGQPALAASPTPTPVDLIPAVHDIISLLP